MRKKKQTKKTMCDLSTEPIIVQDNQLANKSRERVDQHFSVCKIASVFLYLLVLSYCSYYLITSSNCIIKYFKQSTMVVFEGECIHFNALRPRTTCLRDGKIQNTQKQFCISFVNVMPVQLEEGEQQL